MATKKISQLVPAGNVVGSDLFEIDRAGVTYSVTATNIITSEAATRASADSTLTTNLAAEVTNRTTADSLITTSLNTEVTRAEAAEALLAPINSPTFTGVPLTTTPAVNDATTKIATTAYVNNALFATSTLATKVPWIGINEVLDCSGNPNYPAALKPVDTYTVSVKGRIGGASGKLVSVGDTIVSIADNAGGNEATVGTSWYILQHKILWHGTGTLSVIGGDYITNTASGNRSFTMGSSNTNSGIDSFTSGSGNDNSTGHRSLVGGQLNVNSSTDSLVVGTSNTNTNDNNIVGGTGNSINGQYSLVIGTDNLNTVNNSIVSGTGNDNESANSEIIGTANTNSGSNSIVSGEHNTNSGGDSAIIGGSFNGSGGGDYTIMLGCNGRTATSSNYITYVETLKNYGGRQRHVNTVVVGNSPYTTLYTDDIICCTTSGGAITIVPLTTPVTGQTFVIKDSVGSGAVNNITIDPNGATTIDGATTKVINTNYGTCTITYTGSQWSVIAN